MSTKEATFTNVALSEVKPATDNPRRNLGDLDELVASIKAIGLLEPLLVTPNGDGYVLVCGHRRYAAAKKAGMKILPAVVRTMTDRERQEAMLIENLQRSDLTPMEEAEAYRRLTTELGVAQRTLATRLGRSQSHISKRLSLTDLPKDLKPEVDSGGIAIGDALEIVKLAEHPERLKAARKRAREWQQPIAHAVKAQLAEVDRETELKATVAKIEKCGLRYVPMVEKYGWYDVPTGAAQLDAVNMKAAAHAKEPCHAATVNPRQPGNVILICTEAKRHPNTRASREARAQTATEKREAARKAHDKELAKAKKARHEFVRGLVKKRLPRAEVVERIVRGFLCDSNQAPQKIACELLELEPVKTKGQYSTSIDYRGPLVAHAEKGEAELVSVGLALALAGHEEVLGSTWSTWEGTRPKTYLQFLERHGYDLSPAEKLELKGKAPKRSTY